MLAKPDKELILQVNFLPKDDCVLWAMLSQMHSDNISLTILLCNAGSLLGKTAQGFYLYNVAQGVLRHFSYAIFSGASQTTLHNIFPVQSCPRRSYSWVNIAQIKTLCIVVLEAPDNNAQEKFCLRLS